MTLQLLFADPTPNRNGRRCSARHIRFNAVAIILTVAAAASLATSTLAEQFFASHQHAPFFMSAPTHMTRPQPHVVPQDLYAHAARSTIMHLEQTVDLARKSTNHASHVNKIPTMSNTVFQPTNKCSDNMFCQAMFTVSTMENVVEVRAGVVFEGKGGLTDGGSVDTISKDGTAGTTLLEALEIVRKLMETAPAILPPNCYVNETAAALAILEAGIAAVEQCADVDLRACMQLVTFHYCPIDS